jgi:hypothetical protein
MAAHISGSSGERSRGDHGSRRCRADDAAHVAETTDSGSCVERWLWAKGGWLARRPVYMREAINRNAANMMNSHRIDPA